MVVGVGDKLTTLAVLSLVGEHLPFDVSLALAGLALVLVQRHHFGPFT